MKDHTGEDFCKVKLIFHQLCKIYAVLQISANLMQETCFYSKLKFLVEILKKLR